GRRRGRRVGARRRCARARRRRARVCDDRRPAPRRRPHRRHRPARRRRRRADDRDATVTHRDDALTSSEPTPGESSPDDDVTVSVETVAPLSGATMTLPRATLAELEAAGVERPSIIRLMNDYGTPWPLWDAEGPMP